MRRRTIAAVALGTMVALGAAEVLIRTFAPRRTIEVLTGLYPAMFEESEYLPYRLRKSYQGRLARDEFDTAIHINSLGYRDDEFSVRTGGAYRVLAVGDSFTFGWGVEAEETYAAGLERALAARGLSRPVEVINAGFAACYSPDTYYLYLKREGLALQPDLVVVGVFVGNDLDSDAAFENEWVETDAEGLPLRIRNTQSQVVGHNLLPRDIPLRYRTPVLHRLHLFQAVADAWWALKPMVMSAAPAWLPVVHAAQTPEEQVPYIYRAQYAERTERVRARVESVFAGMKRLADAAGVPIVFMIIPDRVQLSATAFAGLPAEVGKPQRLLIEFFEREGMAYVDLLPWLREQAGGGELYFPLDAHWNARGHGLAAERLSMLVSDRLADGRTKEKPE